MDEITITSAGARMNGFIYLAAGPGPHPAVVFFHGYPGNERNIDLMQAVRRAGYHAVYIDPRGMWGSGGTFSFAHGLVDAKAVLAWVRSPAVAARYHINAHRIAIVGHSYGGWLTMMTAPSQPASVCAVGIAAWNVGGAALRFGDHPDERAENLDYFRTTTSRGGPVVGDALGMLDEMTKNAQAWDYRRQASGLVNRALLLVAATRDTPDEGVAMHQQLAQAVRAAGGHRVTLTTYEDDHPFSSHRIALANLLTHWLGTDCANTQR
jgi:pimeloyl-ACP methyl ester carboxylesterase